LRNVVPYGGTHPKTIKGAGSSIKLMKGLGGSLNLASVDLDGLMAST
jgi:hypothetical protein